MRVGGMVLGAQQQSEVAADAAIAGKPAGIIENRQAAQRQMMQNIPAVTAAEAKVAERQARVEQIGERIPVAVLDAGAGNFGETAADEAFRRVCRRHLRTLGHIGKAQRGIHFPEPVGRGLRVIAQALLVIAHGRSRRLLDKQHELLVTRRASHRRDFELKAFCSGGRVNRQLRMDGLAGQCGFEDCGSFAGIEEMAQEGVAAGLLHCDGEVSGRGRILQ